MAERKKPVRRPVEERIAEIDKKIATHEANIETLKKRKEGILNSKLNKSKAAEMKELIAKATESGLTKEQIAEKLGIKLGE